MKQVITSRQNGTVKLAASLLDKKGRRESGLFRFDGVKLLGEAVAKRLGLEYIILREDAQSNIISAAEQAVAAGAVDESRVLTVCVGVFDKLTTESAPEGVITVAKMPRKLHRELGEQELSGYNAGGRRHILIAEALRDPGNLGTVIRSCAALGVELLVLSGDCADLYNPKTVRGAMGALFALPIHIAPSGAMPKLIGELREGGRNIYAAALRSEAVDISLLGFKSGDAFVIGNEGHGLSEPVIDACSGCAVIPMTEGSESLNAAVAAAICIWETVRSR